MHFVIHRLYVSCSGFGRLPNAVSVKVIKNTSSSSGAKGVLPSLNGNEHREMLPIANHKPLEGED